jgi:SAM-dependent methyltransferase
MDLKSTYNKIAKDWAGDHHDDTWWIEGTDKYLSLLGPRALILDVGCGAGIKSGYMAGKGFGVTGIDFSEEMIKIAGRRVPSGKFLVKDIRRPLELDAAFDGVFAQAVLLHFFKKEVPGVLENIIAPLKTGGYFYLAVKEVRPGGKEEEVVKEEDYGYEYERFFSYFRPEEIEDYVEGTGVKIVYQTVNSSGRTNWIQIIARK